MSTAELKIDLIKRISELSNVSVIEQVKRLLDFELSDEVYKLSSEQKERIALAQQEIAEGKLKSDEEVEEEIERWLNER